MKTLVWAWIESERDWVPAGEVSVDEGGKRGTFSYRKDYLDRRQAFALDPIALPLTLRKQNSLKFNGLPGVIRDACPDFWGTLTLERHAGRTLDVLEAGILSPPDTVGALILGEPDDIDRKRAWRPPHLATITAMEAGDLNAVSTFLMPTTGLGGTKPKMTVVDDGRIWLFKRGERGDPDDAVVVEHLMLQLASRCGIETPASRVVEQADGSGCIMVERFDFLADGPSARRRAFASAASVMNFDQHDRNLSQPSYRRFMQEIRRWCAAKDAPESASKHQKELWRRVVFNGLVANIDDHSRNHGLLRRDSGWTLAPAFDLNAGYGAGRRNVALTMNLVEERSGASIVTMERLIDLAKAVSIDADEARAYVRESAATILDLWSGLAAAAGLAPQRRSFYESAFLFAREIQSRRE